MSSILKNELRRAVETNRALLIAGAGVSISATDNAPHANWVGLLESGLDRCLDLEPLLVGSDWAAGVRERIASGMADDLVMAAQEIQSRLKARPGNQFWKWLAQTVGALRPAQTGLLEAIRDLRIPVATTNYDGLLHTVITGEVRTWQEPEAISRICRSHEPGVIHLHGYWDKPETVVLGVESYAALMGDAQAQHLLRALVTNHSVIFAGFGAGLDDANFRALRTWADTILDRSDYPMTVLVRESERDVAEREYGSAGLQVVVYGKEFGELELFLSDLSRPSPTEYVPLSYNWPSLQTKLIRLHRRIKRDFAPDIVLTMSGPGSVAAFIALRSDLEETPVVSAITFPHTEGRTAANRAFAEHASNAGWEHVETPKWDVLLPDILMVMPPGSKVLLFDDRVISGGTHKQVTEVLSERGYEVRSAAVVVHPDGCAQVRYYEDVTDKGMSFPWGDQRGRA